MRPAATLLCFILISSHALCAAEEAMAAVGPALRAELVTLDLADLREVLLLDTEERKELSGALKAAGIPLGARARFRREVVGVDVMSPTGERPSVRRAQSTENEGSPPAPASQGFSFEAAAITVTALMGVISYLLQAKLARDAERADNDRDRTTAERDKAIAAAEVQLDVTRSQMKDLYMPLAAGFGIYHFAKAYLARDVGLTYYGMPEFETMPSNRASPDLEVLGENVGTLLAPGPFTKWRESELMALRDDESLRTRYCDAYRDSLLPPLQAAMAVIPFNMHLCAPNESESAMLGQIFAGIERIVGVHLRFLFYRSSIFCDAWQPIIKRWQNDDYSLLQPLAPDAGVAVLGFCGVTIMGIAKKQEKLQGISAGSVASVLLASNAQHQQDST